jgi:DNA-binding beta-propeller fold protein YncE
MRAARKLLALAALSLLPQALPAQDTVTPEGRFLTTEGDGIVSGVRVKVAPDGGVWFLLPARDQIVRLHDGVMTNWQLRPSDDLGVNPVDFELDGRYVWFIGNGQRGIDAISSYFCRLDTETNEVTEWVVPGTRPAGFWRAPDGKVWIAQSAARLQSVDLDTLQVVDYRSLATFAYSQIRGGADGAIWLVDYGNNRLVRWVPGAAEETSWTYFTGFRLNTSHMEIDATGKIWLAHLEGNTIDRFDPATNRLEIWGGFSRPLHFDFADGGTLYVTEADGGNGRLAVFDSNLAFSSTVDLEPTNFLVARAVNQTAAQRRTRNATRTTFNTADTEIPSADLTVAASFPGILKYTFASRNAYGIATVAGGVAWIGSEGKLVRIVPQAIGAPEDLAAPLAVSLIGPEEAKIRIDLALTNRGTAEVAGDALYLFSAGSFAGRQAFTIPPGGTVRFSDAYPVGRAYTPVFGPVRVRVTSGDVATLDPVVRTVRELPDGGTFGFALPALPLTATLPAGVTRTLFAGAREAEATVLGVYAPEGGQGVGTLYAADGSLRGSFAFALGANERREFNPAASAFGVEPQPGDVIRITATGGAVQAYTTVFDLGTRDAAVALPMDAATGMVFPSVGRSGGVNGSVFESDLWLANPDPDAPASVTISYVPSDGASAPPAATRTIPPRGSLRVENLMTALFSRATGQGALTLSSDRPIAALVRVASKRAEGDYAGFATPLTAADAIAGGGSKVAPGALQDTERRTHLLLYNSGAAGRVTAVILGGDGA